MCIKQISKFNVLREFYVCEETDLQVILLFLKFNHWLKVWPTHT